jgi:predicted GIY-YIG superfamily endonuclease
MVYLIHFERPYRHARHYVGYSRNAEAFERRIEHHRNGTGARLLEVVTAAGIGFHVSRTWPDGTRDDEGRLKRRHGAGRFCPACRVAH